MNFKKQVMLDAQREQKQKDLIDDYGNVMYILGYPVNIGLGFIGGIFDALIIYAIIENSFNATYPAIFVAIALSMLIQFLMGRPVMLITKNFYHGKFQTDRGFGKMLIMMLIGAAVALGVSLYLSWNTDQLVGVAVSPTYESKLQHESEIKTYYDKKERDLISAYTIEKNTLENKVKEIKNSRVKVHDSKTGKWVKPWSLRNTRANIEQKQIPSLTKDHNKKLADIKQERKDELKRVTNQNSDTKAEKENVILWGGTATRFTNIGINIFRVLIVIFYMIFILDATPEQTEQPNEQLANSNQGTIFSAPVRSVQSFVSPSQNNITEQPQTLVTQKVQPIGTTTEQPNNILANNRTTEQEQNDRTVVRGFRTTPPPPVQTERTEQRTEQPRTVVREQKTIKVVINNTDLVNKRRLGKQAFLRSFYPSLDANYQKRKNPPAPQTLLNNEKRFEVRRKELEEEFGQKTIFSGAGKYRMVEFVSIK